MKKIYQTAVLYLAAFAYILEAHLFRYFVRTGQILGVNTITALIPTLYEALDIVSREMVGFVPAVTRDSNAERAAVNQSIDISVVPGVAASTAITPGATSPDSGYQTIATTSMTISKAQMVPVAWTGEEQRAVGTSGTYPSVQSQRFAQAMRTLVNEVEADLAALHVHASRAYGTYNVTPFGTAGDLSDNAQMLKLLEDNGAPTGDLHAVLGSSAIANIRGKQSVLFKVNEAGTDQLLRRGIIGDLQGAMVHNSAQVKRPAAGSMANATTNNAGYAVGAKTITLATAGTGTVNGGDIITFAGDTNKYVVESATFAGANPAAGDTITIAEPGLLVAIAAAATNITVVGQTSRNMYFPRSAIALVTRAPTMPLEGDAASDVMEIVDPVSGLAFQIAMYKQYRQIHFEVGLAWGVKMIAPRHVGLLIG